MSICTFNSKELQTTGVWERPCSSNKDGSYYGVPYWEVPRFNTPVTPKENFQLFKEGKEYYWNISMYSCHDFIWIFPHANPDCQAWTYDGGIDSFGVEWTPVKGKILPAIVKPGNPMMTDVTKWRKILHFPDVDAWDWEGAVNAYTGMDNDRARIGVIPTAFFERLIDLMEFEEAAVAMIEEPEETASLMHALADFNIKVLEHYKQYFDIDIVQVHDDWGAQRAPFFSRSALQKVILPAYKRFIKRAHELDIFVNTHCCGCSKSFIEDMIEMGADMWQLQGNANPDIEDDIIKYREKLNFDCYINIPNIEDKDAARQFIQATFARLGGSNCCITFGDAEGNDLDDPELDMIIYEMARKACSHEI